MRVVRTIITATALIVVCSGAALAEDYRYEQVTKVCPSSGEAECYGTDAQDFIMGTLAVDVIFGKAGDDDIDTEGWEGPFKPNERVRGGTGDDRIWGGAHKQDLCADEGKDMLWGYNGNDTLGGGSSSDTIYGGRGDDQMNGAACDTPYSVPDGDDTLNGGPGEDTLRDTGEGNDTLIGRSGVDKLFAGNGNDVLNGGESFDQLYGGNGDDTLYAGKRDGTPDYLNCEAGTGDVAYAGHGDRVSRDCEKVIPYSKNAKIHRF
jgi:Ca2+-binding RTX toxin-like protein